MEKQIELFEPSVSYYPNHSQRYLGSVLYFYGFTNEYKKQNLDSDYEKWLKTKVENKDINKIKKKVRKARNSLGKLSPRAKAEYKENLKYLKEHEESFEKFESILLIICHRFLKKNNFYKDYSTIYQDYFPEDNKLNLKFHAMFTDKKTKKKDEKTFELHAGSVNLLKDLVDYLKPNNFQRLSQKVDSCNHVGGLTYFLHNEIKDMLYQQNLKQQPFINSLMKKFQELSNIRKEEIDKLAFSNECLVQFKNLSQYGMVKFEDQIFHLDINDANVNYEGNKKATGLKILQKYPKKQVPSTSESTAKDPTQAEKYWSVFSDVHIVQILYELLLTIGPFSYEYLRELLLSVIPIQFQLNKKFLSIQKLEDQFKIEGKGADSLAEAYLRENKLDKHTDNEIVQIENNINEILGKEELHLSQLDEEIIILREYFRPIYNEFSSKDKESVDDFLSECSETRNRDVECLLEYLDIRVEILNKIYSKSSIKIENIEQNIKAKLKSEKFNLANSLISELMTILNINLETNKNKLINFLTFLYLDS